MSCLCSPYLSDAIVTPTGAAWSAGMPVCRQGHSITCFLANIYNICFSFLANMYNICYIVSLYHKFETNVMYIGFLASKRKPIYITSGLKYLFFLMPATHSRQDLFSSIFQEIHHYQLKRGTRVFNRNYLSLSMLQILSLQVLLQEHIHFHSTFL